MAHLSDLQLASLLDEIAAAMRINAPVSDALRRLGDRRLGSVASAARKLTSALDSGMSTAEAIKMCRSPMTAQASAAIRSCENCHDPSLLSHLAVQLRTRYEHSRLTRLTWLYPIFLCLLAYMVAVTVMAPMVRGNTGRDFQWNDWVLATSNYLEYSWPIPLTAFIVFVFLFLIWVLRSRRLSAPVRRLLLCQSLADQLEHGVPEQDAIRSAASLSMHPDLAEHTNPTFQMPEVQRCLAQSFVTMPDLEGVTAQDVLVARLRYASAVHSEQARRRDYWWGTLFPRIAMVVVGGGLTLAYAWWVIRPIYLQVYSW